MTWSLTIPGGRARLDPILTIGRALGIEDETWATIPRGVYVPRRRMHVTAGPDSIRGVYFGMELGAFRLVLPSLASLEDFRLAKRIVRVVCRQLHGLVVVDHDEVMGMVAFDLKYNEPWFATRQRRDQEALARRIEEQRARLDTSPFDRALDVPTEEVTLECLASATHDEASRSAPAPA